MSRRPTLLNALEHANRAVALDTAGSVPEATEEYNRTVELLEGVLRDIGEDDSDNEDSLRIKKICDSYKNRTQLLILVSSSDSGSRQ
ncbi:hypothetical protein RSOLAG1IB_00788 [Rhizoctonia solani AG-1 IB]|uniref:MIT domain-containing protein n=1 Tax=Thanatephorus cucumeris (strain AG1-IB / isolate 7/3/14) TaxID=1108050 RepID=A0A0B7F7Q1_THACB|nr:hypothetical protein RSOLAG1IB_00788 [Rhizoctonia solani AG-1 IB]